MRYRFVDRIVALTPGEAIHCQYTWPADLSIFADHFPGSSIVPGVLLIEMMGQSVSLCIQSKYEDYGVPVLVQVRGAKFRSWVEPNQLLDIHGEVLAVQPKVATVKAHAKRGDAKVADVDLMFAFESTTRLGLPAVDPILSAYRANEG